MERIRLGHGQTVRTFVAIAAWRAIDLTQNYHWCSMQYVINFTSCAIFLFEYNATLITGLAFDLRWLNV